VPTLRLYRVLRVQDDMPTLLEALGPPELSDAVKVVGDLLAVGVLGSLSTPERCKGFPACRRGLATWQVAQGRTDGRDFLFSDEYR
jgi:hypothetical protein